MGEASNPACENCDDSFDSDITTYTAEISCQFLPSMITDWNPIIIKNFQKPGSIASMVAHCALLPSPGRCFLSMEEVMEAFKKTFEKWHPCQT